MLSSTEMEYIQGLISAYYLQGYTHYLCHTITDNYNNEYDICLYVSKEKIEAVTDNQFEVKDGLRLYIDTSSKSNNNTNENTSVSSFSRSVSVDVAEFVYTDAEVSHSLENIPLNPDITFKASTNLDVLVLLIPIGIILLYMLIRDLFRIGGN